MSVTPSKLAALIDWIDSPPHAADWRDILSCLRELQEYRLMDKGNNPDMPPEGE